MKHNYFIKSLLVLLTLMCSMGVMAEEVVYKTALFGASYNSKPVSSYADSWSATNDGFTVNLENWNNNNNGWNYVKCGRKTVASVGTITTAAAVDEAITKVVVTLDAVTVASVNSATLQVATDADFTQNVQNVEVTPATGANTYTVTTPTKNCYYRLTYDCQAKSNGLVTVSRVDYYYDNSTSDRSVATIALEDGEAYQTQLYVDDADEYIVTYDGDAQLVAESSNEGVATVEVDELGIVTVNALAAGTTTITISAPATDAYQAAEMEYTLTVSARPLDGQTTIGWVAADQGFENAAELDRYAADDNISIAFDGGTNKNNTPKYYTTGSGARMYVGNNMTIAAKEGYAISSVAFTFSGGSYTGDYKANMGVYSNGIEATWSGLAPCVTFTAGTTSRMQKVEVTYVELTDMEAPITVSAAGYATYVAPMDMIIGDGTRAFYITGVDENGATLTTVAAPVVAEGEAVLLVGEGTLNVYGHDNLTATRNADNKLVGADVAPVGSYVLQNQNGVVGFYQVEGADKGTNGRAYLALPAGVKAFALGNATGIQRIDAKAEGVTYDLAGRRVNNATKGVYIVNGALRVKN